MAATTASERRKNVLRLQLASQNKIAPNSVYTPNLQQENIIQSAHIRNYNSVGRILYEIGHAMAGRLESPAGTQPQEDAKRRQIDQKYSNDDSLPPELWKYATTFLPFRTGGILYTKEDIENQVCTTVFNDVTLKVSLIPEPTRHQYVIRRGTITFDLSRATGESLHSGDLSLKFWIEQHDDRLVFYASQNWSDIVMEIEYDTGTHARFKRIENAPPAAATEIVTHTDQNWTYTCHLTTGSPPPGYSPTARMTAMERVPLRTNDTEGKEVLHAASIVTINRLKRFGWSVSQYIWATKKGVPLYTTLKKTDPIRRNAEEAQQPDVVAAITQLFFGKPQQIGPGIGWTVLDTAV